MKAFIFDMDGVIIDSEPLHNEGILKTLSYFKVSFEPENLEQYAGTTTAFLFNKIVEERNLQLSIDEMVAYKDQYIIKGIREMNLVPIPGILDLLSALKVREIPLAIASSSAFPVIDAVVEKFQLSNQFDIIMSGESLPQSKPDPTIYLLTAKQLGVNPVDCVVLEDASLGVQAAKAAKMFCIAFQNKNSGKQNLSQADQIVAKISDIDVSVL
ncbi:haloacid dehalogenase superfamily, subfamily IA, variant 3 with third motif having DD or ED/haloacid dehalogenase superfamily, subfamily IA, variant 1 with third motif having Dx(3-4)D or Dx(3-4)E [Propionispira arboris]|uniref:Haloacid dehalogenase superfamily, subfamily IA, variant 3 with third motif having DD or ED/haloacid dehalogenase superfamily, subfamily IA, variant 1 with third motif having Dx(3-4)D or Dx(3-4)E n=1 Tax=Propionispira arboris TaxID=84035 RepID=A0A1H6YJF9_9FIRM|nr:HAD family phosphatase [Propionispira arboris]SEJ40536.1 haloacid dehalogenase superfamily, subfamily IA, variant 3 with third motif having DD or ED/haloacid dehalogenase superfamily, subfamily IA, variant 1 with third motif having Dx(3-4)D or Dx(3-4)E [Propionispira arboris]